jgi:hypothetical protein
VARRSYPSMPVLAIRARNVLEWPVRARRVGRDPSAARIMRAMDGSEPRGIVEAAPDELDPAHLVPPVHEITGWIEQIVQQGIRRPGYDADRWAEAWAADMFRSFGLEDVACEPVELPMWEPLEQAHLEAWPSADLSAVLHVDGLALPHSRAAPEGIEAELVPVGRDASLVAGKLALAELELIRMPVGALRERAKHTYDPDGDFDAEVQVLPFGPSFMAVMEPAIAAGAAGFVGALTGMPWETSDYYVPYDAVERPIPGLWVAPSAGRRLLAMLEAGRVSSRITTRSRRTMTTTHNVVGSLRGASEEWVVIASHHDGPWASAVEDASGTALVMSQAKYWSRVPASERPHNLLFLLTSGHMAGGAGTRAFVEDHADLIPRIVVELHLEHAARRCETQNGELVATDAPEARWWFTTRNAILESSVRHAVRAEDLRRSLVLDPEVFFERPPTDGSAFYGAGVPIVQYLTAPMYLFDAQDTIDKVHVDTLVPLTRAVIRIVHATRGSTASTFRDDEAEAASRR